MSMYIGQMEKSVKVLTECYLQSWGRLKKATGSPTCLWSWGGAWSPPWSLGGLCGSSGQQNMAEAVLCHKRLAASTSCLWEHGLAHGTLSQPEPLCKKSDSLAGEALQRGPEATWRGSRPLAEPPPGPQA